jgi:hypothetical protein
LVGNSGGGIWACCGLIKALRHRQRGGAGSDGLFDGLPSAECSDSAPPISRRSTTADRGRGPRGDELAADAWRQGGGNVWGWISYDPELNLIYYGTAIRPWNHEAAAGRQQMDGGIFARNPDTARPLVLPVEPA